MAISPIQLTPGMDSGTQASAINNNFRQIEAENRTKQIVGETGNTEVVIGRRENGTYGISTYSEDGDEVTRMGNVGSEANRRSGFSIYDEQGRERARFGEMPDGTINVIVTKPGIDVASLF